MKISLQWLSDFLPGGLDAQRVADALLGGGFPVESIEKTGEDTVLDVEVTSNRGDCLSHVGIAREVAALMGREFKLAKATPTEAATPASSVTKLRIEALDLCPHYTARVLRGVTIRPSPAWMSKRLEAVGLRPINNIVDVSNYVMFELGQPLHAFDFDKLGGHEIVVRRARAGEKLVSIDGHERKLTPDMLSIADAKIPVALAGVMGGRDSEVSNATRKVLLESARFDALSVRRTSRALALQSDSSYRFERGIDPALAASASARAAQLMLETAGGELLGGLVEAGSAATQPKRITLRLVRLRQLLGIDVTAQEALDSLTHLQLSPQLRGEQIEVTVPTWRLDLNVEVDLIEEVARVIGYDRIPVREEISIRLAPPQPALKTIELIRSTLAAAGYFEAVTVTFVTDALRDDFKPPDAAALPRTDPMTRKADAHLRGSMLPGLLEAVRRNEAAGTPDARLFEIGSTFWIDRAGDLIERRKLGIVGGEDVHDLRGAIELLLTRLDPNGLVEVRPKPHPALSQNASASFHWRGQFIGHVGLLSKPLTDKLALRSTPAVAELDLEPLLAGAQHVPQLRPLPRFPAVRRDISLIVAEAVRFEQLQSLIAALKLENLESFEHVITYRGKPLEKGSKSITITLVFRSPSSTLTSDQVETSVQRAIDAAKGQLGAMLRT